jgi:arsenite methyltransferase
MSSRTEEMARAEALPQADASSLVDADELEAKVMEMYGQVAREEQAELHFEAGRPVAEHLGYPGELLDAIPAEALASFAGVGYHLDLAALAPGAAVLDLGSGSGTDVFCAAVQVGRSGRVVGVDFTHEQAAKATRLRDRDGFGVGQLRRSADRRPAVRRRDVRRRDLQRRDQPVRGQEQGLRGGARVLRPGGRLALADIVSGKPLKERTRRNVELWAACIAGAIPREDYLATIEAAGLKVVRVRANPDFRFLSERANEAADRYGVTSISLLAIKPL